jgi:terminase small subunit / prophage DNA-packing protein
MATIEEVAAHLDLSTSRVDIFQKRGILPRADPGQLDLDACRVAYIRSIRARASGHGVYSKDGKILDLAAERARLAKEQADHHHMKNEQLRGSLLPRDEVTAAVQAAFSNVKARLLAIPTKAAPLVLRAKTLPAIKAQLTELIHEALGDLAKTKVIPEPGEYEVLGDDSGIENSGGGNGVVPGSHPAPKRERKRLGGHVS